jgi:S1-C subfamily serine protease
MVVEPDGMRSTRGRKFLAALAMAAVPVAAHAAEPLTVQEIVLRAKPAVALVTARVDAQITVDCGAGLVTVTPPPYEEIGTGWFVDGRGYLVTNAHVVEAAHALPPKVAHDLKKVGVDQACVEPALVAQGVQRGQRPDLEEQLRRLIDMRTVGARLAPQIRVLLANGAMLTAEVVKVSPPLRVDATGRPGSGSGRDLALLRVPDGAYPALALSADEPEIGDPLHIIGFPGVVLTHELLNRSAPLEASVTNGAVSGFRQDALGHRVIQTDAAASYGNSGGPAIGRTGAAVGVLTFISLASTGGNIVQGFNFLVPAPDVKTFLDGTAVTTPGVSRFSSVWTAGLGDLRSGRFRSAALRFAEADTLLAGFPDVKRARAEADLNISHPPPRPFPWAWTTLGLALVSGGGAGLLWLRRWRRNRFRISAPAVARMLEAGASPFLLDVRQEAAAKQSALTIPGSVYVTPDALERGEAVIEVDRTRTIIAYCT